VTTVRYGFQPKRPAPQAQSTERVPRVARLLALAHKFQGMLERGEVKSMADLARLGRVSRARITQTMDLLMLAPDIQENLLFSNTSMLPRELFAIVRQVRWSEQRSVFRQRSAPPNQAA
jgi:hypothetical protein